MKNPQLIFKSSFFNHRLNVNIIQNISIYHRRLIKYLITLLTRVAALQVGASGPIEAGAGGAGVQVVLAVDAGEPATARAGAGVTTLLLLAGASILAGVGAAGTWRR